jgi:hypothetical protein
LEGIPKSFIPTTKRIFKAVRSGDKANARKLQKVVFSFYAVKNVGHQAKDPVKSR